MKNAAINKTFQALFLTVMVLSLGSIASAQGGTFNTDTTQPFSGAVGVKDNRKASPLRNVPTQTFNLGPAVRQGWQLFRTGFTQFALNYLNERDVGGGIRTSRNVINLAENGNLFFATYAGGFTLKYVVKGNRFETSFRTPGPLPSGTDPRVAITCDAEVMIDIVKTGYNLTARPAQLKIKCSRPTGRNFTGDLLIGVNDLIATLGGPDFIGKGLRAVNDPKFALNAPVSVELSNRLGGRLTRDTSVEIDTGNFFHAGGVVRGLILTIEDDPVAGPPQPPPAPPKPPFIYAGQAIIPTPNHPFGIVPVSWDGGPDHPNVEVFVSIDNSPEIPAYSIGESQQSPVWKQPKISTVLNLQRYHHYRFVLRSGGKTLSSAAGLVVQ